MVNFSLKRSSRRRVEHQKRNEFRVMGTLNSSSIDELGNWCYQRLVGAPRKYQAQQGGFEATP